MEVTKRLISVGVVIIFILAKCSSKKTESSSSEMQDVSVQLDSVEMVRILNNWKIDSIGCKRLRDFDDIKRVMEYKELIGQDSSVLCKVLGGFNSILDKENNEYSLVYAMDCTEGGKRSYYNLYCHFRADTLWSYSAPVF